MHQKIQEVLENILQDKNETDKFLKMESADEIYDYFLEKIPDLSEEEFEDFMVDTLETYIHEQGKIEKLSPDSLNNVSGGVSLPKRFAAGIAGVLTLIPSASGLQTSKNMSEEAPSYLSMAKDKVEHVKFQVSNKFRKLKQLIKENPIISSIVAAAILAVTIMTVVLVRKYKNPNITSQVSTNNIIHTNTPSQEPQQTASNHEQPNKPLPQGASALTGDSVATSGQSHSDIPPQPQPRTELRSPSPGLPTRVEPTPSPNRLPHFARNKGPGRRPPTPQKTAPGTPPRGSSTHQQVHQSTPRPKDRNNRRRITVAPTTNGSSIVSFDPNPRPTSDGASVRVQPTTPLTNPATPPELPPKPSSLNPDMSSISTSRSSRNSGRRSHRRQNATLTASSSGAHDGTSPSENPLPLRPDQVGTADANNAPKNFLSIKERMTQLDTAKAASQPQPKPTGGKHKRGVSPVIRELQGQVGSTATNGMQQFTQQAANPGKPPPSAKSLTPNSATQGAPVSTIPPQRPPRPRRPAKLPDGYDRAVELFEQYLYDPKFKGKDPKSNSEYNKLSRNLLAAIPADGGIPGATPANGATEVIGFLRTGKNALNNAFTQLRNGAVPKCMQSRGHTAGEPNNDKYATLPR